MSGEVEPAVVVRAVSPRDAGHSHTGPADESCQDLDVWSKRSTMPW